MNITKFFKHVKAIKIILTGVHCMFVAQMTIYTDLFFEIGIQEQNSTVGHGQKVNNYTFCLYCYHDVLASFY